MFDFVNGDEFSVADNIKYFVERNIITMADILFGFDNPVVVGKFNLGRIFGFWNECSRDLVTCQTADIQGRTYKTPY